MYKFRDISVNFEDTKKYSERIVATIKKSVKFSNNRQQTQDCKRICGRDTIEINENIAFGGINKLDFQFNKQQKIKCSLDEIWEFISSPGNLKEITPDYMGFDIMTKNLPEKMYAGMIISYTVSPILGLKTTWVTEITHIVEKKYFIDEQRVGPYSLWHHQHIIEPIDNGVLMTDIVSYKPPLGFIGAIANFLIIKNKLQDIFEYRTKAIEKRFGIYMDQ